MCCLMKRSKSVKTSKKPAIIIPTMILFYLHHEKRQKFNPKYILQSDLKDQKDSII